MTSDGEVTTPSYPETLHVVKLNNDINNRAGVELPPAFLEVELINKLFISND